MWRFETLIKGMRARKDRPEVAVRMEAGLVDVEYGEGWRGGGSFSSTGEDSSVHEQRVVWDHHVCVTNAMSINPTPCQE